MSGTSLDHYTLGLGVREAASEVTAATIAAGLTRAEVQFERVTHLGEEAGSWRVTVERISSPPTD